jgi:hypothetical protein
LAERTHAHLTAVGGQLLDERVVAPVVVGVSPARGRGGERRPRVEVVLVAAEEGAVVVDQHRRDLARGRLGPVRQRDRAGDRVGCGLDRRTLDAGGIGVGIEREPQGGPRTRGGAGGRSPKRSSSSERRDAISPRSMASAASSGR